ncbi:MAG: PilZ domain-containing protein [Acidobacteriia bacterium]|nr:PilZ domain-containing protein [Terriglobia bacterium]
MATMADNMETIAPHPGERRAARRFRMKLPVTVRSFDGVAVALNGLTLDISETGVFFYVGARPREQAPIEFMVELPAEVTMTDPMRATCKGRVVRVIQDELSDGYGVAATIEGFTSFIRLSGGPPIFSA